MHAKMQAETLVVESRVIVVVVQNDCRRKKIEEMENRSRGEDGKRTVEGGGGGR
jgi:hypothetical protein